MDQLFEFLGKIGGIGAIGFAIYKMGVKYLGNYLAQKHKGEIDKEVEQHR